ncbi:MAG: TIGR01212 family radical SAM protein [Bacteroidales bacterium]|nr:TIGR01212 family radical SAM protein [Bacteroidales bacterium]
MFGARVQKVSLDAGFSCPNRDGTKGYNGCAYCNNDAFNPSYCKPEKPISQQLREGIMFHEKRYRRSDSYLAYFQAYSNTYAPVSTLKKLYSEALSYPGIKGLIIGTRPDCVDEEILDYLQDLSSKYYISVEYGIESCYDRTLLRINRGHTFAQAEEALKMTAGRVINCGAHFIFGLPGETRDEMLKEAEIISRLPLKTVKFHQLQIIKGTSIEREYNQNPDDFQLFTWGEYLDFIIAFLELLNPAIIVDRFTGEAPPRFLANESWGKKRTDTIVALIERRLEELGTWQGRLFTPKESA